MGRKRKESVYDFPVKIHVRIQENRFAWCWLEQIPREVPEDGLQTGILSFCLILTKEHLKHSQEEERHLYESDIQEPFGKGFKI